MDDQLDDDLRNRIKEVFDNYEDTSADEGWLLLREKYPEKGKKRPVVWLWWSSAAAVLLLVIGLFWLYKKPINKEDLVTKNKAIPQSQVVNTAKNNKTNAHSNSTPNTTIADTKTERLANNTSSTSARHKNIYHQTRAPQLTAIKLHKTKQETIINKTEKPAFDKTLIASNETVDKKALQENIKNTKLVDSTASQTGKTLAAVAKQPSVNMLGEVKKAPKSIFVVNDTEPTKKIKSTSKTVRFGVYAATYFNYAKGSNDQFNVGAGFTADIRIDDHFDLSTGLTIAQNSLSYNSQSVTVEQVSDAPTPGAFTVAADKIASDPSSPVLNNYHANLIGLDIPLNIKYKFNPKKNDTYISAGLSSGTFISETYNYLYKDSTPFDEDPTLSQNQSGHKSFNSFYFARTLNLSFGTGYALGRNMLIIEPFLKYPLAGLGSQQLRFGAGGINLKFNIRSQP